MDINEAIQLAYECYQKGNLQQAEQICREILQIQPNNAEVYNNLGFILYEERQLDEAINCYQKALELNPNLFDAYYNLGNALKDNSLLDEAISCYQKALQLNPNLHDAYINLAIAHKKQRLLDEAINCYKKALHLDPDDTDTHFNLEVAIQMKSQVETYINSGNTFKEKGQLNEAITYYRKAFEINVQHPGLFQNILYLLLLTGNLKQILKDIWYFWRIVCPTKYKQIHQPLWDGSDIKGLTVFLHASFGGFGDTILFIRYALLISKLGAKVVVESQNELFSLLQSVEGIQQIIVSGEPWPDFDVHCPIFSLPMVFDTTLATIPSNAPYVAVNPALVEQWGNKIKNDNSKLKVGLVWSAGYVDSRNLRVCPLQLFSPLSQLDDISFYSLQKGKTANQAKNLPNGMNLIDYTDEINDFSDTAAFIENLDLTISVDTAVAHLAGALSKPVWTLLEYYADWKWLENREDSPWYPTMRLFRQPTPGDWESVINRIYLELDRMIK